MVPQEFRQVFPPLFPKLKMNEAQPSQSLKVGENIRGVSRPSDHAQFLAILIFFYAPNIHLFLFFSMYLFFLIMLTDNHNCYSIKEKQQSDFT